MTKFNSQIIDFDADGKNYYLAACIDDKNNVVSYDVFNNRADAVKAIDNLCKVCDLLANADDKSVEFIADALQSAANNDNFGDVNTVLQNCITERRNLIF